MTRASLRQLLVVVLSASMATSIVACGRLRARAKAPSSAVPAVPAATATYTTLRYGFPDEEGMDATPLIELAKRIRDGKHPIFSILISRNGRLVFELYTSLLTREHAHYVMSVTKSFTSALVGAAIQRGLVPSAEVSVSDALPAKLFRSKEDRERFRAVTLRDVLAMSALDAQVPPHRGLPEDVERQKAFMSSENRAVFALTQSVLPQPGVSFQYTDITPIIATAVVEYASGKSALEFADDTLFGPMGFRNHEWMHQDKIGIDNGAYGLRLRPVDMQKFGILYLRSGEWEGRQLLPRAWVEQSFAPWIKSRPNLATPNYGWYWWSHLYAPHWTARMAVGWKGQRIAVIPEQALVVTLTALVEPEDGDEEALFDTVLRKFVMPSIEGVGGVPPRPDPALRSPLAAVLEQVRTGPLRAKLGAESRMIPSIAPKEVHHAFTP